MNKVLIVKHDWQVDKSVDEKTLNHWEKQTGYKLPDDYKKFLLTFNGGVTCPWMFRHGHPQSSEEESILDYLHDWDDVVENSNLDVTRDLASRPPNAIEIGQNPGGGAVLLSLDPNSYGQIVYWIPSHLAWGDEPNNIVAAIAPSFSEFINRLFDDGETEHSDWDILTSERTAVPLVL